jgi:hypothetical protein
MKQPVHITIPALYDELAVRRRRRERRAAIAYWALSLMGLAVLFANLPR